MAFKLNQVLILLGCLIAVSVALDFAAQDLRRFARAKQQLQRQRALRPLKRILKEIISKPSESSANPRFSNYDGGSSQRDGAEYDEYGNRKKYGSGHRRESAGSGTLPRGYDRGYQNYETEPRPVYNYPPPSRTIDTQRKAVIDEVDPSLYDQEPQQAPRTQRLQYNAPENYAPQTPSRYEQQQEPQPAPSQRVDYAPETPRRYEQQQQQVEPQSAPSQRVDYAPAAPSYTPAAPRYGPAAPRSDYVPASAPAFAQDRQDLGPGGLEAAVAAGAGSFAPNAEGVYQNEDRLFFQIHGQQGPDSYRYGYDTGNGYNRQFRYEERTNEGYVKGRYGFFDKYGKLHVVNYSADPIHGFHAEGAGVPEYPH